MGREALAEAMIPVIGRLYRENNVVTSIHGRSLINKSTMNILKLTELFAPDLMAHRLNAFERHYTWIDPHELSYFRARISQAPRDSEHGIEIVRTHCITP
ncbi:hypothetical protein [Arthrobacter sp. yr096]|uniref:hypothetical protein n=1 Tax=Arthrobacter sp. yr096 TaxID=1761750 RepID=UPI003529A0CD